MRVEGISQTIASLKKYGKEAVREIEDETEYAARSIEKSAKNKAPVDTGALGQSIIATERTPLIWDINAGGLKAPYAAFVEFGTGRLVSVPKELQEEAIKFKGKTGRIITNRPQPYLYPALVEGRKVYLERLKKVLNKYGTTKSN